jgi:hypothetical protein
MPGPVPNHSDDLARDRSRKGGDQMPLTKGTRRETEWPEPDPEWHHLAIDVYNGCRNSGQADFYQQSDIALLASLCDDLSYAKNRVQRSGQLLQTIYTNMSNLLVSEGDRRRVRIELDEPKQETDSASLSLMSDYREGLGVTEEDA